MAFRCDLGCDDGWLVDEETRKARPCPCREQRIAQRRTRALQRGLRQGVPERYQGLAWARHPLSEIADLHPVAARAVRRYCDRLEDNVGAGRGLWLLGNKGTGKTTLAYMVSQTALERGLTVLRWNTTDLLNRLRQSISDDGPIDPNHIIDAAMSVDVLQLEDLAVPRTTEWVLEQLYTIVNLRYEEGRAIVFTSDVPYGEPPDPRRLGEAIGERTWSRLVEIAGDPILLLGKDMRLVARAEADAA